MSRSMDEHAALDVVAVRAIETADRDRVLWSDADRAWATRAAAELVGERASPATFLARRAALALERLSERAPKVGRAFRAWRWRPWIGTAIIIGAFILGVAVDRAEGGQRINVLAPPVLGLLVWNLAIYAFLAIGFVVRYGDFGKAGRLRRAVMWLAEARHHAWRPTRRAQNAGTMALTAFASDWPARVGPLYAARAARVLHLAAAALALGVITGLYLRGIAFEYRATWESTFLDAATVRSILAIAYAPGAWITGIPVPDVASVAAIAAPSSENAARWLHLMAATLVVVVIVPRLLLALATWVNERYRAAHLVPGFDEPYFERLLREFDGGAARVRIVPYSFTPGASELAALESIVVRAFGGNAMLVVEPPVAYGDENAAVATTAPGTTIALFNLTATPERETHGAFIAALIAQGGAAQALRIVVDEAAFRARWREEPARIEARRALWREFCAEYRVAPVFVDLAAPDLETAAGALDDLTAPAA
jgi:hypothetical protein